MFLLRRPSFYFYFEDVTTNLISLKPGVANRKATAIDSQASMLTRPCFLPLFVVCHPRAPRSKLTDLCKATPTPDSPQASCKFPAWPHSLPKPRPRRAPVLLQCSNLALPPFTAGLPLSPFVQRVSGNLFLFSQNSSLPSPHLI